MATRTARKPSDEDTGDGESGRDERIGEVTFRPRERPNEGHEPLGARGKNAAHVRS